MRISGSWYNELTFSAVRWLSLLRLSLALLLGWSLLPLPRPPTSWLVATWIIEHLQWSVRVELLHQWLLAVLSTTSLRPRFLQFLRIWSGIALCCLVVALLPFNELNERGRLVTGLAFALKVESNGLDLQLVSTWRTSATSYSVPLDLRCPYLPFGQPTTGTSLGISSQALSPTDFLHRKKHECTVRLQESDSQTDHGSYPSPAGKQYSRRHRRVVHPVFSFGCAGGRGFRRLCAGGHEERWWSPTCSSRWFDCYGGLADGLVGRSCFGSWSPHRGPCSRSEGGRWKSSATWKRSRCPVSGCLRSVVANLVPMELSDLDPTSVLGFHEDVSYLPDAATLLKLTKEWVASATAERVQFYSADEGGPAEEQTAVPKQKAKAKASTDKPKTVSAAKQVASHIPSQISSLLPNMASQLAEIQEEQKNMREAFRLQNMLPPPRGTQTPVTMPMQSFAKMLGAPPRTKQVTFAPPPPKKAAVELDSALNVQEQAEEGDHLSERSPLAMAMLEQSRALTTLVSHLQSGDPLVDNPGVSSGTSSRGSQGREKLQRELSQERRILLSNHAECLQEDEASQSPSGQPGRACPCRFLDGTVYGALRWLRKCQRPGHCAICFELCGRFSNAVRLGRSAGAPVFGHAGHRAGSPGRRSLGLSIQSAAVGRPTASDMVLSSQCNGGSTGRSRAFCSLCPQRMATVSLAFMKEMDYIAGRRQEMVKKSAPVPLPAQPAPKPKRKGKFPKGKPEAYAEEEA